MDTWFELWDGANASLVGTYDTRGAALVTVRHSLDAFGPASVASLVLTVEDGSGEPRVIASGSELAELARTSFAAT